MAKQFTAFTAKLNGRANVLKTPCGISEAFNPQTNSSQPPITEYECIWDTGATSTVITSKVAKDLGLKPISLATSHHAGGSSQVPVYLVNVYLPNNVRCIGIKVIEAVLSGNTEVLIGMDIISMGDFSFTNVNGKSCFSFRTPSIKEIDYVEEDKNKKPSWLKSSGGRRSGQKPKRRKR